MANESVKKRRNTVSEPKKEKTGRKRPDWLAVGSFDLPFFLLVLVVLTVGLVMLFSASYTDAYYNRRGDSAFYFKRQLFFAILGLFAMLGISKVKYDYFKLGALLAIPVSWALLVFVLIIPPYFKDFHRWIYIGNFTFQPSEIAKLAIVLFCAWGMDKNRKKIIGKTPNQSAFCKKIAELTNGKVEIYDSFIQLIIYSGVIAVTAALIYLENHVSGTLLLLAIGVVMLYLGEFKKHWFILIAIFAAAGILLIITKPDLLEKYAGARITAWLDKDYQPLGARWQTNNSLYAIGSGGLFGVGLGNSKQKHLYVSEPQNDFIFAIICEELGFIGAVVILILFALLVWRGVVIGIHARDRFGALLSMGIVFQVGLQTALNIGVVTDMLPNTGISLPFFSYGGTSLMMLLFEMGLVLAVSRYSRMTKS